MAMFKIVDWHVGYWCAYVPCQNSSVNSPVYRFRVLTRIDKSCIDSYWQNGIDSSQIPEIYTVYVPRIIDKDIDIKNGIQERFDWTTGMIIE